MTPTSSRGSSKNFMGRHQANIRRGKGEDGTHGKILGEPFCAAFKSSFLLFLYNFLPFL